MIFFWAIVGNNSSLVRQAVTTGWGFENLNKGEWIVLKMLLENHQQYNGIFTI